MKKLDKTTRILAKLVEVAHWIAVVGLLVLLVLTFFMGTGIVQSIASTGEGMRFAVYALDFTLTGTKGMIDLTSLRLTALSGAILMALMAMVFRNIYLIMKNAEGGTPFQKDNVRMLREIGIFLAAQPILSLILSWIIRWAAGPDMVEASIGLDNFIVGMVALCLSQFFAHGVELENDTEGLL